MTQRLLSAFSALEVGIVIEAKKGEAGSRELDLLLHRVQIEIVEMTPEYCELRGLHGGPLARAATPQDSTLAIATRTLWQSILANRFFSRAMILQKRTFKLSSFKKAFDI